VEPGLDAKIRSKKKWPEIFSAPNNVNMCPGDENGCIPIEYFNEIKNIHTGKQIEIKSTNIINRPNHMRINLLVQSYVPYQLTGVTPITILGNKFKYQK